VGSFRKIHTYKIIAYILDLDTLENDASFDSISVMFK